MNEDSEENFWGKFSEENFTYNILFSFMTMLKELLISI